MDPPRVGLAGPVSTVARFAGFTNVSTAGLAAEALARKGHLLSDVGDTGGATRALDDLVTLYGGSRELGRHVPSPLFLADHLGQDTPREQLLREVLALTKLNWNSSRLGGLLPITLRFAHQVRDILKELPPDVDALPQPKFYL